MATATFFWYSSALSNAMGSGTAGNAPNIDFLSDTIKCALTTSTHVPSAAHAFYSDLTNELATAGGYTSGGFTLASKTLVTTAANSWGVAAAVSTAYAVGDIVRPSTGNGHLYRCIVAGTSGGSAPTWPTVGGQTVTDGTVTWAEAGIAITVVDAADISAGSCTFTCRNAHIYDDTPATAGTKPLIAYATFNTDVSPSAATFSVVFSTNTGIVNYTVGG